jgi:iron complex outermembrane receptor protein
VQSGGFGAISAIAACATRKPSSGRRAPASALLALIACTSALGAQQRVNPDTTRVVRLPEVDVSVTRTPRHIERVPAAISVVSREQIQNAQPGLTLDEDLVSVPGVFISNRYDFSQGMRLSIRGFGARAAFGVRGVRIIADGIPLTMPDGQAALNNIDLSSAERIEVIRGPSSALYGNASGGVVSIETEEPGADFSFDTRVVGGDYGRGNDNLLNLRKLQLKASDRRGRFSYLASGSRMQITGFRDYSRARQTMLNGKASYALSPSSYLTLVLNAADVPLSQSPGAVTIDTATRRPAAAFPRNIQLLAGKAVTQVQSGVRFVHDTHTHRLDASVYGLGRALDNPTTFAFIHVGRSSGGARATYAVQGRVLGLPLTLTTGADAELMRDNRTERNNKAGLPGDTLRKDQLDQVGAVGPFVQGVLSLLPSLELTLGVRYDAVAFKTVDHQLADGDNSGQRTLRRFSPLAGLMLAATPKLSVYTNVGTSFQTPTTTELINAPPAPGVPCCKGGFNTALDPQHAISYEAGIKGHPFNGVRYEVAAFVAHVEGELVSYRLPPLEDRDFFRNAGKSRHRGVELGVAIDPAYGPHASASYTYSDFQFIDDGLTGVTNGKHIPGVAPHHLFGSVGYRGRRIPTIDIDIEHVSRFFASDGNEAFSANPAYTTADVRMSWSQRVGQWALSPFIAVNNVTDKRYNGSVVLNATARRYFEPAPGRNLYFGIGVPYYAASRSSASR